MLFPENLGPLDSASIAFNITWEEMGYVKDDDADDINYDDLLKETQKGSVEENKERVAAGYPPVTIVGWASQPYYDKDKKVLHWAKEIQFGDVQEHTLNYDVRVLGRKGVLSMNAIGTIDATAKGKRDIPANRFSRSLYRRQPLYGLQRILRRQDRCLDHWWAGGWKGAGQSGLFCLDCQIWQGHHRCAARRWRRYLAIHYRTTEGKRRIQFHDQCGDA